ncbi:DUF2231 domain-containing protein [Hazenella coriacea]|uniref:Putative membrane protein n=1 Tax=Hazenella coriacea TaxID=1179467 RepID=A0A4V2UV13_9BACL|nr:DUF2231 domain-containing protein [Hazenella coriacea]TCS93957.1 putative membrane protein [Hazenella coriacea]
MIEEIITHLHPIFVHFPIAFIIIGVIYDFFLVWKNRAIQPSKGFGLWCVAALGTILAVITGPEDLAHGNTDLIEIHEKLGNITMWLTLLMIVLRLWVWYQMNTFKRFLLTTYLILSLLIGTLVSVTGFYGGKMVYNQGVGVKVNGNYVNPSIQTNIEAD